MMEKSNNTMLMVQKCMFPLKMKENKTKNIVHIVIQIMIEVEKRFDCISETNRISKNVYK